MTGLFKQLRDHGVDILTYRMIGIERIESFNSKRKLSFNPTIINLFQPVVQDIHIASIFRSRQVSLPSIAIEGQPRLLEILYRPQEAVPPTSFYNSCDSISLIELTLLQLSDALINALKEKVTMFFFKVEYRILHAIEEAIIYFSNIFASYNISLYIEISHCPIIDNNITINSLVRLKEHDINLAVDNFLWQGGDWRKRYLSSGIFNCVKFGAPPSSQKEINDFKDCVLSLQEKYSLTTIISKIETKKQHDIALSSGSWAIQGFYYSKPRAVKLMDLYSFHTENPQSKPHGLIGP